jgi:hypothetical protein
VITVTKETLLGKMFISVNDNDTMRLDGGPMQLVNGSVLVLDFTKYDLPDSMNSSNRIGFNFRFAKLLFVLEFLAHINWQSIQRIVCEQRLMIDYGVSVHFVHTDLRVIALVPPKRETLIPFKFPAVVPLKVAYSDGLDPAV